MTAEPRQPLVLGAAVGYAIEQVEPFLVSLRRTGYDGDVALLVDRRLATVLRERRDPRLILVPTRQWLPLRWRLFWGRRRRLLTLWRAPAFVLWTLLRIARRVLPAWPVRDAVLMALATGLHPPHSTRFLQYRRLLRATAHTHVLLTDVRDVVFQEDPFPRLPGRGLAVSVEPRDHTLASEPNNAAWLRLAYGEGFLAEFGTRPVSCSGVTFGDRGAVLGYLDAMREAILALDFRQASRPGIDQALHNALICRGALADVTLLETLDSPVATLSCVPAAGLQFDARGRLLNRDRSLVCVLHMYDRIPQLKARVLQTVREPASNPRLEAAPS